MPTFILVHFFRWKAQQPKRTTQSTFFLGWLCCWVPRPSLVTHLVPVPLVADAPPGRTAHPLQAAQRDSLDAQKSEGRPLLSPCPCWAQSGQDGAVLTRQRGTAAGRVTDLEVSMKKLPEAQPFQPYVEIVSTGSSSLGFSWDKNTSARCTCHMLEMSLWRCQRRISSGHSP